MAGILDFDPYTNATFQIESGGNPNAVTGSNRGLGQFGPQEERMYGINDANRTDPEAQAAALAAERARNDPILARALGRPADDWEHYFTHQQGQAGGPALLSADPNTPAWQVIRPYYKSDAIAKQAITGNIPTGNPLRSMDPNSIATGAFTGLWRDKFNRALPGGGQEYASGSPAGPPVQAGDLPGSYATASAAGQQSTPMFGVQPQQQSIFAKLAPFLPSGGGQGASPQQPMQQPQQLAMPAPMLMRRPQVDYSGLQRPQVQLAGDVVPIRPDIAQINQSNRFQNQGGFLPHVPAAPVVPINPTSKRNNPAFSQNGYWNNFMFGGTA